MLVAGVAGVAAIGLGAFIGKLAYDYWSNRNNDRDKDTEKEKKLTKV